MKKLVIYSAILIITLIGCGTGEKESEVKTDTTDGTRKIEVVESMKGGGYTFVKGKEAGNEIWIAVREMPVSAGEVLYFTSAMEMKNFESKSLNKTFENILFVDQVSKTPESNTSTGEKPTMPGMVPSSGGHGKPEVKAANEINISPLADGMTVETVNRDKKSLAGKTVKVRGVVTKYNGGIMNRNWIHIQDGTTSGQAVDLTVTSEESAKVGQTVVIEGTVTVDKDFGAGYFYEVIVENAKISVEKEI